MTTHTLVVHDHPDHPDAGIVIEHPGCPTRPGDMSSPGHEYVQYACAVEEAAAFYGLPWRHRDDDPGLIDLIDMEPMAPGRYVIEVNADERGPALVVVDAPEPTHPRAEIEREAS